MAQISINFDLSGLNTFVQNGEDIADLPMDNPVIAAAINAAADVYDAAMVERYELAMRGPGEWTDLSYLTKKEKIEHGQSPPLINVSYEGQFPDHEPGQLMRSLATDDENHVREPNADGTGVLTGTEVEYAADVHYGHDNVPARPIIVYPDETTFAEMQEIIQTGVVEAMSGVVDDIAPF